MLALLFRLFEPEPGGAVEVDGVDVTTVALQRLRGSLAIVPQVIDFVLCSVICALCCSCICIRDTDYE